MTYHYYYDELKYATPEKKITFIGTRIINRLDGLKEKLDKIDEKLDRVIEFSEIIKTLQSGELRLKFIKETEKALDDEAKQYYGGE